MLFVDFLKSLVKDAQVAFESAILASEAFRQVHYEEKDGVLHPKTTKRRHGEADVDVPHKTQHHLFDFIPKRLVFDTKDTGIDIYEKDGVLHTHLKDAQGGLFEKDAVKVHIRMEFEAIEPPEGVSAQRDKMVDRLKGEL